MGPLHVKTPSHYSADCRPHGADPAARLREPSRVVGAAVGCCGSVAALADPFLADGAAGAARLQPQPLWFVTAYLRDVSIDAATHQSPLPDVNHQTQAPFRTWLETHARRLRCNVASRAVTSRASLIDTAAAAVGFGPHHVAGGGADWRWDAHVWWYGRGAPLTRKNGTSEMAFASLQTGCPLRVGHAVLFSMCLRAPPRRRSASSQERSLGEPMAVDPALALASAFVRVAFVRPISPHFTLAPSIPAANSRGNGVAVSTDWIVFFALS
jgi:hypothetical protein